MDARLYIAQTRRAPAHVKTLVLAAIRAVTPRSYGHRAPRFQMARAQAVLTPLSAHVVVARAREASASQTLATLMPFMILAAAVAARRWVNLCFS